MDIAVVLLGWAGIVLASMLIVGFLAPRWGRDPFGWLLLAAATGPIAIVALLGTRQRDLEHPEDFERIGTPLDREAQKVVLLACDGSAQSEAAARFVVENHEDADEVVILTVFPLESRPGADGGGRREHDEEIQKCTRGALQAIEEGGIHGRIIVGYGKPAEEILRAADEERADVIAVGRRGAGLSKAVLGSTSDAVLKKSKRPVVVID